MHRLLSVGVLLGIGSLVDSFPELKRICLGSPLYFNPFPHGYRHPLSYKPSSYMYLVFLKDGIERTVADTKQSFDPHFQIKHGEPYIGKVMKSHEGEYYWRISPYESKLWHVRIILKYCGAHKKLVYGEELSMDVPADASELEFTPADHADKHVVLWSRMKRLDEKGARGTVTSSRWTAQRIIKADQESNGHISSTVVTVEEQKHVGVESNQSFINMTTVQPNGTGRYKIQDEDRHLAMPTYTKTSPLNSKFSLTKFLGPGWTTAICILIVLCCCCYCCASDGNEINPCLALVVGLLCCCCIFCSDDKDQTDSTAAPPPEIEPSAPPIDIPHESTPPPPVDFERCQPHTNRPSEALNTSDESPDSPDHVPPPYRYFEHSHGPSQAPPSGSPTDSPNPCDSTPPPYSCFEDCRRPSEAAGGSESAAPPAPSAPPDPGLQYQPAAWGSGQSDFLSGSPLNMDSSISSTYTSDKLNF